MTGKIKTIVSDRGFGFITGEDTVDYFFHDSSLVDVQLDELDRGDSVSFDVAPPGSKGPRAANVTLASKYAAR